MDENNSDILKQKKKIDKLDNNNKIIDQEKNETVFYIVQGPGIPFGFNTLSFLDLPIPSMPIENIFVSSGLNLPFSKGITDTALGLGWYKSLLKKMFHKENFQNQKGDLNKVIESIIMMIMMKNIKKMEVWEIKQMEIYIK